MNSLAALVISLVTATYIAAPFLFRRGETAIAEDGAGALESRRDLLLRSLKELEFDHRTGKIDNDEYRALRSTMANEAAEVLSKLEKSSAKQTGVAAAEDAAEALIARARKSKFAGSEVEDAAEKMIREARLRKNGAGAVVETKPQTGVWVCSCGHAVPASDRFCGACGLQRAE